MQVILSEEEYKGLKAKADAFLQIKDPTLSNNEYIDKAIKHFYDKKLYFASAFLEAIKSHSMVYAVILQDLMMKFYSTGDERLKMEREKILDKMKGEKLGIPKTVLSSLEESLHSKLFSRR